MTLVKALEDKLRAAGEAHRPKRAKKSWQLPADIADPIVAAARIEAAGLLAPLVELFDTAVANRRKSLYALSPAVQVVVTEAYYWVKSSFKGSYRSQGFGAEKYAREALRPWETALQAAGLSPHVSRIATVINPTAQWSCDRETVQFRLWVNCEPYVADAVLRRVTVEQAVASWKSHSVNPRVYDPFLPYEMVN